MDNEFFNILTRDLSSLLNKMDEKNIKRLDLKLLERIIVRLGSFSENCEECNNYITELYNYIKYLQNKYQQLDRTDYKEHKKIINKIIFHLQKEHKLVPENYYTGAFMSIGISFGFIIGLLIFDNFGLGLPIGLCFGLSIGSAKDQEIKKKGLTI